MSLVMDSIQDITKSMHKQVRESELQSEFVRSQIHQVGKEQKMIK